MPKLQRLRRSICLHQWPVRQRLVEDCMVPGPAGLYAKTDLFIFDLLY
jgi:hypothetical protein